MKALKTAFAGLAATMAFTSVSALAQTAVQDAQFNSSGLAVESIASGEALEAIALLRQELRAHPNDPALLINLGIALAHSGQEADARASFEAALSSGEIMDLETAGGEMTDSRLLARRAIAMLNRGDFRSAARTEQIAQRD